MPERTQIIVELRIYDFAKDPSGNSPKHLILFDHLNEEQKTSARQALGHQASYAAFKPMSSHSLVPP